MSAQHLRIPKVLTLTAIEASACEENEAAPLSVASVFIGKLERMRVNSRKSIAKKKRNRPRKSRKSTFVVS